MQNPPHIQFLQNHEIDKTLWDESIDASVNRLIYAKTFYLDNIAPGWDALAGENYHWVMPLTHRRKFGISYLYQPSFTQQLGVFFKPNVTPPYVEIIQLLQKRYRFCEINWNWAAPPLLSTLPITIHPATNYVLDLSPDYTQILSGYHLSLKKSLKSGNRFGHIYRKSEDFNQSINLYKEYYGRRIRHVTEGDYNAFADICSHAKNTGRLVCRQVIDAKENLLASILLLQDGNRLYNLMDTTTETGRQTQGNHFLLDQVIREFAGQNWMLDFEGSDLPGVQKFYATFAGINQQYYTCRYNRLPSLLRILKK